MLSNTDLAGELQALAQQAENAAAAVRGNGDLPARPLAAALVEAAKIGDRLAKLQRSLSATNGKKGK